MHHKIKIPKQLSTLTKDKSSNICKKKTIKKDINKCLTLIEATEYPISGSFISPIRCSNHVLIIKVEKRRCKKPPTSYKWLWHPKHKKNDLQLKDKFRKAKYETQTHYWKDYGENVQKDLVDTRQTEQKGSPPMRPQNTQHRTTIAAKITPPAHPKGWQKQQEQH